MHERGILKRRQFDDPNTVGEPFVDPPYNLSGKPGLAHSAGTSDSYQPVVSQESAYLLDRRGTAHETRHRMHQAGRLDASLTGYPSVHPLTISPNGAVQISAPAVVCVAAQTAIQTRIKFA